ncbi:MAG: nucleotidyltransferase domain-containing protein [bacterium]
MLDLPKNSIELILEAIRSFSSIDEAVVFGSRAKGKKKRGSDIDIAIKGEQINLDVVSKLSSLLNEELPLPYYFDIIDYNAIKNEALREHINRVGQIIFPEELNS